MPGVLAASASRIWSCCRAGPNNVIIRTDGTIGPCFPIYSATYNWGTIEGDKLDRAPLGHMKQIHQKHCFSTLNHSLGYCYSDARVIKWPWRQARRTSLTSLAKLAPSPAAPKFALALHRMYLAQSRLRRDISATIAHLERYRKQRLERQAEEIKTVRGDFRPGLIWRQEMARGTMPPSPASTARRRMVRDPRRTPRRSQARRINQTAPNPNP